MQYGKGINTLVSQLQQLLSSKGKKKASAHDSYIQSYVAIIVLFCASGTGVFGAMREGMTGDASILIAKAFLDFFTATIFACTGIAVAAISVPMLLIQLTLAACAAIIMPLTTPMMLADFSAVGGMLLVATGLRICGIKNVCRGEYAACAGAGDADFSGPTLFLPEDACF